MPLASAGESL